MAEENRMYTLRYLLSFIIAVVMFSLVFLIASQVSYLNYLEVSKESNLVKSYISDLEYYASQQSCSEWLLTNASEKLDFVGSRLSILETRLGKTDSRVIEQKNLYTELEYKHFQIVDNLVRVCGAPFVTFLFFYSNEENDRTLSERNGFILGTLKNKYPERAMIYSFDYNIESKIVEDLKKKYNLTKAPVVVINKKDVVFVNNIEDIEKYFLS